MEFFYITVTLAMVACLAIAFIAGYLAALD